MSEDKDPTSFFPSSPVQASSPQGGAVNKFGNEVIDPTKNVLDLVEAAVKRLDDIASVKDDKLNSEVEHLKELMEVRSFYESLLREAEAKRIDAIRIVDVQAVSSNSAKAADQATVLANQVAVSAETLRKLVETTAAAAASQFQQVTSQISDRIAALEKTQYEGAGKDRVVDPMFAQLLTEMKLSREAQSQGTGVKQGANMTVVYIISAIGLISTILGIVLTIMALSRGGN